MNEYEIRKQEKIERYRELAEKADRRSSNLWEESRQMASMISMGQPILIGHHSEKRDRRFRARIGVKSDASFQAKEKAEYWTRKADALENNKSINAGDPEAVTKMKEKIEAAQAKQDRYKTINKAIRKGKTREDQEETLSDLGYSEIVIKKLLDGDSCGRIGIPQYETTNNGANIRRMKKRLIQLQQLAEIESTEEEINGIKVIVNIEENRVQIFFPEKPSEEIRQFMKQHGFHYAPSWDGRPWQRAYSEAAVRLAKEVTKLIEKESN